MNAISVVLGDLSVSAFAGLLLGCLRTHKITADLRMEDEKNLIISVWRKDKHYVFTVNKETKEVSYKRDRSTISRQLSPLQVAVLLNKNSTDEEVVDVIWPKSMSDEDDSYVGYVC